MNLKIFPSVYKQLFSLEKHIFVEKHIFIGTTYFQCNNNTLSFNFPFIIV